MIDQADILAVIAAALFGTAMAISKHGLRYASPRLGASISVPASAVMFWCLSPFFLTTAGWSWPALGVFAAVGVLFPAAVTTLIFESTHRLGPTTTGSIASAGPVFAVTTAALFLHEPLTFSVVLGTASIVAGVVALCTRGGHVDPHRWARWLVVLPLGAAAIRGVVQTVTKLGLILWPNPFAASLIGYTISAVLLMAIGRRGAPAAREVKWQAYPWFIAVGLANATGVFLTYWALQIGRVTIVSPIIATGPLFTLFLTSHVMRLERLTAKLVAGVLLTVVGVAIILVQ